RGAHNNGDDDAQQRSLLRSPSSPDLDLDLELPSIHHDGLYHSDNGARDLPPRAPRQQKQLRLNPFRLGAPPPTCAPAALRRALITAALLAAGGTVFTLFMRAGDAALQDFNGDAGGIDGGGGGGWDGYRKLRGYWGG